MKKLLITLAILPILVSAQLTPDSLLGCYAGTYMYKTEFDNDWTTIYADTLIVFNVDTDYIDYNGTVQEVIGIGWMLVNPESDIFYIDNYWMYCTYGFPFKQCPWGVDSMRINNCDTGQEEIIFSNNDSIYFMHECWKNSQTDPYHYIWFEGKKISSQVPDSLLSIYVSEISNHNYLNIFPNPTTGIVNIKSNNNIKQYELYNIEGVLLKNNRIDRNEFNLNLEQYSKGIYFLKLTTQNRVITKKIIKQ